MRDTTTVRPDPASDEAMPAAFGATRLEVLPLPGIEARIAAQVAGDVTVTVTCSPRRGTSHTVDTAVRIAALGYRVVPHLSARTVAGKDELKRMLARLDEAGIDEGFVIGGDGAEAAGPYSSALALLEAMSGLDHGLRRIGIGGYPGGHPLISDEALLRALVEKAPLASYVTTQLCFDCATVVSWIARARSLDVVLPVQLGVPGVVARNKLLAMSMRVGVGESIAFLRKHRRIVGGLLGRGEFDPSRLIAETVSSAAASGETIAGLHVFTFNAIEATEAWRLRTMPAATRALKSA